MVVAKHSGPGRGQHGGSPFRGQNPGGSLTTHTADTLASAVVVKASADACEMLWTAAERPDGWVVAAPTGSVESRGPADVPWASAS